MKPHQMVRIDLTPLVDVVFLLLIFFMVSTTFQESEGLDLRLPEASSAQPASARELLRVAIDASGRIVFDGRELTPDRLEAEMRRALAMAEQQQVIVEADAAATHGVVVKVMDALRRAGAKGLTVGTRPGPAE